MRSIDWNAVGAIATAAAVLYALYRDVLTQPKLKVTFNPEADLRDQNNTVGRSPEEVARWLRICVVNTKSGTVARNCRAYIAEIRDHEFAPSAAMPNGVEVLPHDVRQCSWMHDPVGTWQGRDLLPGIRHWVDVMEYDEMKGAGLCVFPSCPLGNPGDYTLTIQVSAEGAAPVAIKIRMKWTGGRTSLRAHLA